MLSPAALRLYKRVFLVSAIYNLVWGVAVICFPRPPLQLAGFANPEPLTILFWQCIGMFVLVYAVGYAYLARDPVRYAPFALVALLGKICGPIGWVWAWQQGLLPAVTGLTILTNDLAWWPFLFPFVWWTMVPRKAGG